MEEPKGFNRAKEQAEKLAEETERIKKILERAVEKAEQQKHRILDFWNEIQLLISMIRAYFSKEYTRIPWKTIVFALAAVIYFLNPLDIVPDLVPTLGFLDDATVMAFVVNALKEDLEEFKNFQAQTKIAV
ncbi:MAG: DUF1232 domain-containing protein [Calditrichia bacterium]